jgi:branched-chain amino acid transport system ATP-binding protein
MTGLLEIEGLAAGYGVVPVLDDITLATAEGSITALVGNNGAGKSTLMRAVAGLIEPNRGRVRFDGEDITGETAAARVARGMALVPEGRLVFPDFTVEETLKLGAYTAHARPGWIRRKAEMYALFPQLAERRRQRAETLSGGEQQMLALARALMSKPRLLLLDEPSLGLAPLMVTHLFETILAVRDEGVTVFIVEQNVHTTLALSDYAYVLENGRLVTEGAGPTLLGQDAIKQAYLGL